MAKGPGVAGDMDESGAPDILEVSKLETENNKANKEYQSKMAEDCWIETSVQQQKLQT